MPPGHAEVRAHALAHRELAAIPQLVVADFKADDLALVDDLLGDHVTLGVVYPVIDCFARQRAALLPQQRLVAAQHGHAARAQPLEDFQLRAADALPRAEELDVRGADIRDDRDIRARRRRHPGQLAEVVHAHLEHGRARRFFDAQHGQRHADLVIQVALGLEGLAVLPQHGGDHLLGRRLADRAGHADHPCGHLRAVAAREV